MSTKNILFKSEVLVPLDELAHAIELCYDEMGETL